MVIVSLRFAKPDYPLHPSHDEIIRKGFYLFVLPEREKDKYGWVEDTYIYSWYSHCSYGLSSPPNPISANYHNPAQDEFPRMGVEVCPRSVVWDHRETTVQVPLKNKWSRDGAAEYYIVEKYASLRFKDTFGNYVQIGSTLPVTEVIALTEALVYVGPEEESVVNPWDWDVCEDRRPPELWRLLWNY